MRHSFLKSVFDPTNYKTYHANCHCGTIRYTAAVSPSLDAGHEVVTCNCPFYSPKLFPKELTCVHVGAMCIRTGAWNVYVPVGTVTFTCGEDKLKVTSLPAHPSPPTFFLTISPELPLSQPLPQLLPQLRDADGWNHRQAGSR